MNKIVLLYSDLIEKILIIRRLYCKNTEQTKKKNCNRCKANYFQYPTGSLIEGCRLKYETMIVDNKQIPIGFVECPKPITKEKHRIECDKIENERKLICKFLGLIDD